MPIYLFYVNNKITFAMQIYKKLLAKQNIII